MTELTTAQSVKQSVRQFGLRASDTWKLAGAKTSRSDTKVLDVALVKATTPQTRVPPKEKHVRTLKLAVSGGAAHKETGYVLTHLLERLRGAADWLTALKTLITIHRLLAESGEGLWNELLRVAGAPQGHSSGVLGMDNFIDTTNIEGRFDFSEFCRAYGKYLDEQLGLWSSIHWSCSLREGGGAAFGGDGNGHHGHAYDDHFHGAPAAAPRSPAAGGGAERFRTLPAAELLVQLPRLQRLQRRLVDCVPRGAATHDSVVMAALDAVVRESFRLYKAVSEGVINLADAYFTLPYLDAVKGLEIYREASESTQALSAFYGAVGQLGSGAHAGATLPSLTPPPADFVVNMEEYLADAPRPEGAGLPAKKAAPLRKGRLATPGAPRPGDPAGQAPLRTLSSDPGMVATPPSAGEDLVKVAGARDPFATLAGLSPAAVGKAPSPGAGFL